MERISKSVQVLNSATQNATKIRFNTPQVILSAFLRLHRPHSIIPSPIATARIVIASLAGRVITGDI